MAKIITIDAGHGGSDSGAVNGRRHEADDVLKMAQAVGKLLTAQGIKVVYTRTADKDITINERCEIANKAKSDYFLSIHRNSGGGVGFEIWVHSEASSATSAKAKGILDRVVAVSGKNRGVKKGAPGYSNFGINRLSNAPSALFEMGFIDSNTDNALFDKYFNQYAVAVAKGLCSAVGITYKEVKRTSPAASTSTKSSGGSFEMKAYKNGSTKEYVYETVADCKAQKSAKAIGYLNPRESCSCYGRIDGMYLVVYKAGNTKKGGFVKYSGGVK